MDKIESIVKERGSTYGHPLEDFTRSTTMLSALGYRFIDANGITRDLNALDIPIIMCCIKLAREVHMHNQDNLDDISGYVKCADMCREKLKQQFNELSDKK